MDEYSKYSNKNTAVAVSSWEVDCLSANIRGNRVMASFYFICIDLVSVSTPSVLCWSNEDKIWCNTVRLYVCVMR